MELKGTTILAVRDANGVTIAGDGQVTMGQAIVMKHTARKVRKLYHGKVVRIIPIGAFVELVPGKEGMIHISKLENHRVEKVEDVVKEGDMVWVKVLEIDDRGRINLSRKDAMRERSKLGLTD